VIPARTNPLREELRNIRDYEHLMTIIAGQFTGVGMIPYEVYAKTKPNHIMPRSSVTNDLGVQRLAEEIRVLQQRVNALKSVVRFTDPRERIESRAFGNMVTGLPESVRRLRARGYKFQSSLDQTADELKEQWKVLRPSLCKMLQDRAMELGPALGCIQFAMRQLIRFAGDPINAEPLLAHARVTVGDLERRSRLAMHEVNDPFAAYRTKVGIFAAGLEQLEWTLNQGDEAKFQLRAGEGVVIGAKATWLRSRKDHPEGVLYLTNQRMIFEQKQNVATKKFFFIITKSKLVHQALLEVSIKAIEDITATKKGFFRNKDHLEMTFASGMSVPAAYFSLHGQDSLSWEELVRRAKSGNLSKVCNV
jgi:hypothetical protein